MAKVDFSGETLKTPLIQPFHYQAPKAKDAQIVREVVLRRLYGPDLSRLKQTLQSSSFANYGSNAMIVAARDILSMGIEDFLAAGGKPVEGATIGALVNKLPLSNVYKLLIFIMMLTRETSHITASYRCSSPDCGRTIICDLNPEQPIPDGTERERLLMQDVMSMYSEKINGKATPEFTYKLKSPYTVENPAYVEGAEVAEGEKPAAEFVKIFSLTFAWPRLADYITAVKDDRKRDDPDLWALYSNLTRVNELSPEETKELKDKNGFEAMMRMKSDDFRGMMAKLDEFSLTIDNVVECPHCGYVNDSLPFDFTNFFDFLRS